MLKWIKNKDSKVSSLSSTCEQEISFNNKYSKFPSKQYGESIKLLGKGISCHVYLYQLSPSRNNNKKTHNNFNDNVLYAVKRFTKRDMKNEDDMKFVMNEIQIHSKVCKAKHIANILDFFVIQNSKLNSGLYLILEYFPSTLEKVFNKYRSMIPQSDRLCYFKQIADGIVFLQENNISHRDIKPDNCCIDNNGLVKIIDFGSSKIGNLSYGLAGTKAYAAPEVYRCIKYNSFISDVWSLGIVLINMYYCTETKWEWAKHDDVNYMKYKEFMTIENMVKSFSKVGSEDLLVNKELVDNVLLKMLTVDPLTRVTLKELVSRNIWFQNIECCQSTGSIIKHNHGKYL